MAWVYDDNVASQQMSADVTAAPEVIRGCAVTHRRDVGSFAHVLSNLVSLKDMFWLALYSVDLVRQLELDSVAGAKISPHLVFFIRCGHGTADCNCQITIWVVPLESSLWVPRRHFMQGMPVS